ncbi:MAG: carbohydrate-binding domain-containing protein, partial [Oscillospiraceae bacterium]|nr:carbohydrate-binding domain-containing protein [Oscillospiraceae bacterium]
MRHNKKNLLTFALAFVLLLVLTVPACMAGDEVVIRLSESGVLVDGKTASTNSTDAVYVANDIIYYEDRDAYASGNPYGEGTASERHSAEEAAAHTVVHITKPGVYRVSGTLSKGQIFVDLGSEAKSDPNAVVTLLLDNANITCTVAPAVFFYRVYECDQAWVAYDDGETEEYTASAVQDTAKAGANVVLADGSVNNVSGSHVARIYKDNGDKKKLHKYDAAFYSRMSMNIAGETAGTGVLNVTGDSEGLDTELHLTINGGKINIRSQDDGINTNEDNVSVTTINGGALHIVAGLGQEGDGIDSNGYLVINGGVVIAIARPQSDSGLDSDCGSYINGGYVVATGSTMDWAESDSEQVTMNLQFASAQDAGEAVIVTDQSGKVVFAYDPDQDETTGTENR